MAKRKKHPKLPNGFGSIKLLSGNRTNKYAVHPPVVEYTDDGSPITPKAICYVPDWYTGFYALMEYHNGTFDKEQFSHPQISDSDTDTAVISKIIASYNNKTRNKADEIKFSEVYQAFFSYKFERSAGTRLSKSSVLSTQAAYKNCSALHNMPFRSITAVDLQNVLDACQLKHASKELIMSLFKQMYKYAIANNLIDRDYSMSVRIDTEDDDESGEPFSENELKILWSNKENPTVQMILIMCYSGYRILAYKNIEINFSEKYFCGGVKTKYGKNRIVPIYSGIFSMVSARYNGNKDFLRCSTSDFRLSMYKTLDELGILYTASGKKHTPHDCRHTFSMLCEKYGVNENDRKRMMGHSFGSDLTNGKYGHRTTEDLKNEIEKIQIPE